MAKQIYQHILFNTAHGKFVNIHVVAIFLFVVLASLFIAMGPYVLPSYYVSLITRAFLFAGAALTVSLLWGYTGILTFSQAAFFGIGAYAAGLMFTHVGFSPLSAMAALILGILVAMALATFIGWLAFYHGATPIYVAVVTLVVPIGVVQLIYAGGSFTGASTGLSGFEMISLTRPQRFWLAGGTILVLTVAAWIFARSDFGRVLNAIRDNEDRCRYLGIRTTRIKTTLMAVMAGVAALAGFIYACTGRAVAPEHADFVFGTELVVYTALAGRAFVIAPVLGTVGLETLSGYISSVLPFSWRLFIGALFVLVILYMPQGLLPPVGRVLMAGLKQVVGRLMPGVYWFDDRNAPVQLDSSSVKPQQKEVLQKFQSEVALQISALGKSYGSLRVLDKIDLTIGVGEFVGIVGPNGAGKTTLMRCLSDGKERTSGAVSIFGVDIGFCSPAVITGLGLGRSFQNTSLFNSLTVFESLRLARFRNYSPSLVHRSTKLMLPEGSYQVIKQTGLLDRLRDSVDELPHGQKRGLELAMALALEPKVLLLDEPTAGLTKTDRIMIGRLLTSLRDQLGLTIVLIEHDFDFVKVVCSRLVVLHGGKLVLDGETDVVVNDPLIKDIYAGEEIVN